MMRESPNLLPAALLKRRSQRLRTSRWGAVLVLEALLGVLVALVLRFDYDNPAKQARDSIDSTVGQIDVVSARLAEAQAELQAVQQQLAVATEVAGKPDWSIVLTAVAWSGQGLVELSSTQLMASGADGAAPQYRLALLGVSATRADVSQFVQALEKTGIFSRVRIGQTQRVANADDANNPKVGFSIEAWLAGGG